MTEPRHFELATNGPFSLAQANAFGFGQREASHEGPMLLAFATDGDHQPTGVVLRQFSDGSIDAEVHGNASLHDVAVQLKRILSLDHDGNAWQEVIARNPPLKAVAEQLPGLRPVLFHSPYEAAAWSIISARRGQAQSAAARDRISAELGTTFHLAGEEKYAFPTPEALLDGLKPSRSLSEDKVDRLHAIARAAAEGDLEAAELQALGPAAATERLLELKGIGPFYAMLIVVRATGFADIAPPEEPRLLKAIGAAYNLGGPATLAQATELSEQWRPFRTWATVTFRAGAEHGIF